MKKIIFGIFILSLPAVWWLFGTGYFNMHDDLQFMRVYQMEKCFNDGQIPCRWSPDMGEGYGQAMFNFYSVFPYYLGAAIRTVTPLSLMGTVKILFMLSIVVSGVGMYLLVREFWGKWAGIMASVFYMYAPYHALDVYVRGAMAESYALAALPFIFLFFYRLVINPNIKNTIFASLTIFALATSHNISTMIYAPITLLWVGYWLVTTRNWQSIKYIVFSGILGFGLSSFFLLPALFEQKYIQTGYLTSEYFDYKAHFVTLSQLFISRYWNDGGSYFGPYDEMSFQVGWPHWWIASVVGLIVAVKIFLYKKLKTNAKDLILVVSMLAASLGTLFLTHPKSVFIWLNIPFLNFVQFPWRFLGLSIFFISFAVAYLAKLNFRFKNIVLSLIILSCIILNYKFFIPVHYSREVTDEQKLTGVAFELQRHAAVVDYLPKTAKLPPGSGAPEMPVFVNGSGELSRFEVRSNGFTFNVKALEDSGVSVPVMYFPGWNVYIAQEKINISPYGDFGLIKFDVPRGEYYVIGKFENTFVRSLGNLITILSFGFILLYLHKERRHTQTTA